MFCTNCGANVPVNSNFCGLCGAKITTPVAGQSADTSNTDAPARTTPETVQFAATSTNEAPGQPKPEAVQFLKNIEFEGAVRKVFGLGVFWVITAIVATSLLPASWIGWIGLIILAIVLAGFGSIALSLVFGGDGFDYPGRGFLLALFGFLLVKFVFGWDFESPYAILKDYSVQPPSLNGGEVIGAVFLTMAMDFGKVAVGMVIVAIPTLPIILKLHRSRG